MSYKIYSDKKISQEEWNGLTGNSFYASTQFAALWRAKGGVPLYYVDEAHGKYYAGIGGVVFGNGMFKRYDSMPDGLFGGPFFAPDYDEIKRDKFLESFEKYLKKNYFIRANINKPAMMLNSKMFKSQVVLEHVLELGDESFVPSRKEVRKHIRGSRERGGQISKIINENDLDKFYRLALKSEKSHHRKLIYPIDYFRRLLKLSIDNSGILWLKVMLKDEMIASQITLFEKDSALNWALYFDKSFSYYKPAYFLADFAIDYAIKNRIKYFSMGGTPGQIVSVTEYKERWGCRERSYDNYQYQTVLGKLICGWRRR